MVTAKHAKNAKGSRRPFGLTEENLQKQSEFLRNADQKGILPLCFANSFQLGAYGARRLLGLFLPLGELGELGDLGGSHP